jgi:type II secretory pathway pseudopilin PulG
MSFNSRVFGNLQVVILILIITILVMVVSLAYFNAQTAANDQKRLADIDQIQKALKFYYDENGFYPANDKGIPKDIETYLNFWPTAPSASRNCTKDQNNYTYTQRPGTDYWVTFCLGSNQEGLRPGVHRASSKGIE